MQQIVIFTCTCILIVADLLFSFVVHRAGIRSPVPRLRKECGQKLEYCIARNFGEVFNLVIWRILKKIAKLKLANI